MTLQQILTMISLRYPHTYADSYIITMINDIQRRIFRTLYKVESADTYDLVAGTPFYPISYPLDSIIEVVVNGTEYPYKNIRYDASGRYFYVTDEQYIAIVPTPVESIENGLVVFHYKEPAILSVDEMEAVPDLDSTWHELIVYHVCRRLAEIKPDGEMVKHFALSINEIEGDYKRTKRARPHRIQDVYGVGRSAF